MKKLTLAVAAAMLLAQVAFAQKEFKKAVSGVKRVEISLQNGALDIEGYSGSELVITTNDDYDGPPERAKGLKPLFNSAVDNTGMGLEVKENNGTLTITKAMGRGMDYKLKVPASMNIAVVENDFQGGKFHFKNLQGEIEAECKGSNLNIENCTGPIVASNISGDIVVVFTQVNPNKPTSITCTSGDLDVTLPAATKANLVLNSISGEIFTDLDIYMGEKQRNLRQIGGNEIKGTLNGGGVEIALRAISANIYLRKK